MSIIPKMTDPLSSAWDQPDHSTFLFDDTHVLMSKKAFDALKEYSCSQPSGVYDGKMWKACPSKFSHINRNAPEGWFLLWYGPCEDPDKCSVHKRKILLL